MLYANLQPKNKGNEVSFIVPVLDYSPASKYNIKTLIEDLRDIPGELIIVFNSEEVANEMKDDKRINHYAVMSCNVGVSRAWNIGLNICRTPYAFILNSDLHIEHKAIKKMLEYAKSLEKAAMIGPQGSFFSFEKMIDYVYLDKGMCNKPTQVDAVSGFLFLLNKNLLDQYQISFDNQYTPCYQEEWDIGLQIKKAGLKNYVVPVTEYEHFWSGSIRAYKKIRFYDEELTPASVLIQNKAKFTKKWNEIAKSSGPNFLKSYFKNYVLEKIDQSFIEKNFSAAENYLKALSAEYKGDQDVLDKLGMIQKIKK